MDLTKIHPLNIEKPNLNISFIPVLCSVPLLYAHSSNIFAENGLNVSLLPAQGWSDVKNGLIYDDQIDMALMLLPMPLACNLGIDGTKANLRLTAISDINSQMLILAKKHKDLKDIEQMKGFKFAVPYEFSMHYYLLTYFLAENGLDPLKDVSIVEVAPFVMPYYLKKGWIDGFFGPEPFNQVAIYKDLGFYYKLTQDVWTYYPCCCFATSQTFLDNYPVTYKTVLNSIIESARQISNADIYERKKIAQDLSAPLYLNTTDQTAVETALISEFQPIKEATKEQINKIELAHENLVTYGKWILSQMQRWGQIKGEIDYDKVINDTFIQNDDSLVIQIPDETTKEISDIIELDLLNGNPLEYARKQPFSAYCEHDDSITHYDMPKIVSERLNEIICHIATMPGNVNGQKLDITSMDEIGLLEVVVNEVLKNLKFARNSISEKVEDLQVEKEELVSQQIEIKKSVQTNIAKSNFLANMSHEIRTPMNAIIGLVYLCKGTELTSKQYDYLNKIDSAAQSLLRIINDVLDFSKIESGKLNVERIEFNLDDVMSNIIDLVSIKAAEKGLQLKYKKDSTIPGYLVGDPFRLSQILLNLINNAIKFTKKGKVYIKIKVQNRTESNISLVFNVQDTGIGINEEQLQNLFQPFMQAATTTSRDFGGTGLGLAISKKLAEMMNGDINVKSTPEKGSTFTCSIPFDISTKKVKNYYNLLADLKGLKALVIENNSSAQERLVMYLNTFGFSVTAVRGGQEALNKFHQSVLENTPYKLVLTSWKLPKMSGLEVMKAFQQNFDKNVMPKIIMVTAYGRKDIINQAKTIGFDGFLVKPVCSSELFNQICELFYDDIKVNLDSVKTTKMVATGASPLKGKNILLVEDNVINQMVAQELLENAGLVVDIAENGREAIDKMENKPYDAVLMDIQMPVMDGYEATIELRSKEKFKNTPIIAMTANAMSEDAEKCLSIGMDYYISKPVDPKQLLVTLLKFINVDPLEDKKTSSTVDSAPKMDDDKLFASLKGLSVSTGLEKVAGNKKLYKKLLLIFYNNNYTLFDKIKNLLDADDLQKANYLVHSIKGVAANIGALELYNISKFLEYAIKNNDSEKIESAMTEFFVSLSTVLSSIELIKDYLAEDYSISPTESQQEGLIDRESIASNINKLLESLETDISSAIQAKDVLIKQLIPTKASILGRKLDIHVENFEIDKATMIISKIKSKLEL